MAPFHVNKTLCHTCSRPRNLLSLPRPCVGQCTDGSFGCRQDTVVGMTALAEAAGALQSTDTDVSVRFIFGPRGKNMRVSRSNALTLQKYEVSGAAGHQPGGEGGVSAEQGWLVTRGGLSPARVSMGKSGEGREKRVVCGRRVSNVLAKSTVPFS